MKTLVLLSAIFFGMNVTGEAKPTNALTVKEGLAQTVKANTVEKVQLDLSVAPGFHIQANSVPQPFFKTNVLVKSNRDLETFSPKYPSGKKAMVKALGKEVETYEGQIQITIPVRMKKTASGQATQLEGEVRYQACDENLCYQPERLAFALPVSVKK